MITIFCHGGRIRKMLTVEVDGMKYIARGDKPKVLEPVSYDEAMNLIGKWLRENLEPGTAQPKAGK